MEWFTLVLTFLTGITAIYYFFLRRLGTLKKLGILHIKPLPIFGNMANVIFRRYTFPDALDNLYRLNDQAKYVGLYEFAEPVIMIRSPDLIKDITIKHFDHFVDHRGFIDAKQDPLFGSNLFSLRGDKWKEMRNLLTPAFTGSKMKLMFKLMSNYGKEFAKYMSEQSIDGPKDVNTKDSFTRYTNDVIATCAFGISVDSMRNPKNDFYVLGRDATNFDGIRSMKFFLQRNFPGISKFFNLKLVAPRVERFFESVVKETIETRDRQGITRPDMIQLMMESRGNKTANHTELTITDMTSQAFTFFFGGFESTSSLMCFLAYHIAVYPDIQKKLQEEIDRVMEKTNGELTYEDINGMKYLDAVINETLRLYPIAPFLDRQCVKSYELPPALPGGKSVIIEPGQNIWIPVYSLHRDPKYFHDPHTFNPERFLDAENNRIDPFVYLPFGQGPRICIGNRFALLETKVLMFHLLANCHLNPSPKTRVPLELSKKTFAMTAEGGFWLQFESRNNGSKIKNTSNDVNVKSSNECISKNI